MRNNLDYYTHDVNSHNHWKFKALRKRYGWAGEGKFWALNNMIAASENCVLDLNDEVKLMAIAAEIDFDMEEIRLFFKCLVNDCRLLVDVDQTYTTTVVSELFEKVDKTRERKREWKMQKVAGKNMKSTAKTSKSTSTKSKSTATLHRVKESRVKESRVNNIVSKDTIVSAPDLEEKKLEKTDQKELKEQYRHLEKSKQNIYNFLKNHSPLFTQPYCDFWNLFAAECKVPKINLPLTKSREKNLHLRIQQKDFDFPTILKKAKGSSYLLASGWFAFDWIVKNETNFLKIIEGNYDVKETQGHTAITSKSPGSEIYKSRESTLS